MFVITEWLERYEVNDKGQPARAGDKLRVRPLEYIRSKCHGKRRSAGFAVLQEIAGDRVYEVFGIFEKFLEIAGDEIGGKRGKLLNARGKPASAKDLSLMLSFPEEKVEYALKILTNDEVGWMENVFQNFQENPEIPGKSGKSGKSNDQKTPKINEIPTDITDKAKIINDNRVTFQNFQEKSGGLYNETKRNETERNETERNETLQENLENQENLRTGNNGEESIFGDFQSASFSLRFDSALGQILNTRSKSDRSAIRNLVNWLNLQVVAKRFDESIFQRVAGIAKESKNGRNPRAVFFSRLDEEIGYRARVVKEKQK